MRGFLLIVAAVAFAEFIVIPPIKAATVASFERGYLGEALYSVGLVRRER
jgi:hypothetical protein